MITRMDIEELQKRVIEFRDARDWEQFQSKRADGRGQKAERQNERYQPPSLETSECREGD